MKCLNTRINVREIVLRVENRCLDYFGPVLTTTAFLKHAQRIVELV